MSDTPITDRRAFFADNRSGDTVLVVEAETARQLERMCEELANHGACMFESCGECSWCVAIAKYAAMKAAK